MRGWILGLVLAVGLFGAADAQEQEIEGVISNQLEAFKADDFEQAFTFAAPNIQGIFQVLKPCCQKNGQIILFCRLTHLQPVQDVLLPDVVQLTLGKIFITLGNTQVPTKGQKAHNHQHYHLNCLI